MKNIIENKKAELTTTEIVKIILAVIGIGILLYLTISLYGIFFGESKDVKQAKASLDIIAFNINKVAKGEKIVTSFLIESPKDWWIMAWPNAGNKKPTQCKQDSCICICPEDFVGDCDKGGVCEDLSVQVALFNKDSIPSNLKIEEVISFDASLFEPGVVIVKVSKEDGGDFGGGGASGEW